VAANEKKTLKEENLQGLFLVKGEVGNSFQDSLGLTQKSIALYYKWAKT